MVRFGRARVIDRSMNETGRTGVEVVDRLPNHSRQQHFVGRASAAFSKRLFPDPVKSQSPATFRQPVWAWIYLRIHPASASRQSIAKAVTAGAGALFDAAA